MELRYNVNDKMPFGPLLMYGAQWLVVTIPIIVVIVAAVGKIQGLSMAEMTFYTQKMFILAGVSLLIQLLFGHKLPVVVGPASLFLVAMLSAGADNENAVYTSIVCGGAFIALLSYTSIIHHVSKLFTGRIITVVLVLIALTLTPTILHLMIPTGKDSLAILGFDIVFLAVIIVLNKLLKGVWKSTVMVWSILLGTMSYAWLFGMENTHFSRLSIDEMANSLFISDFDFNPGVLLAFFFCYIAFFINEFGSVQTVEHSVSDTHKPNATRRGMRFTGLMNVLDGLFGVLGTVDYSMSPGVILNTGCASRYAMLPTAIGLMLIGVCAPLVALFVLLPQPVMGVLLLYLMSSQLGAGLRLIHTDKLIHDFDDAFTVAFPVMLGVIISFIPAEVSAGIPALLRPVLSNGFVMGVIAVLLIEHGINRKTNN